MTTLQSEFWTHCNLLSSKSVSEGIAVVQSAAHQSVRQKDGTFLIKNIIYL